MRACFTTPTPCYSRASSSDSRSVFTSSFPRSPSGSRATSRCSRRCGSRPASALYLDLYKYWLKIFAVVFAMGVVSGIVMSYQFGTNWAVFSDRAGPVIGPLMAYEVLTAFFLEAGFLGVMLFGMKKVGKQPALLRHADGGRRHLHLGVLDPERQQLDADAGRLRDQRRTASSCRPRGWMPIIFNPSFPYRLVHTVIAAYLTTALVVGAVGAWHLLKDSKQAHARKMFSMAMWMAALVAPVQILVGDHARPQHARAPARQGHGDGRALSKPPARCAADPVRHSGRRGAAHGARHRDSAARHR